MNAKIRDWDLVEDEEFDEGKEATRPKVRRNKAKESPPKREKERLFTRKDKWEERK